MRKLPIPESPGPRIDPNVLGAEIKLGFELIHGKLSDVDDKLHELAQREKRTFVDISGSVLGSATAQTVIDLQGPALSDQRWELKSIAIGSVTPTATAGGRADLHSAASNPLLTIGDTSTWRDQFATLPATKFYGNRQFPIVPQQRLWVVFSSSSAITYVAHAVFEIFDKHSPP